MREQLAARGIVALAIVLMVGCSVGDGKGMLVLTISADPTIAPPVGTKLELNAGAIRRSLDVAFPPSTGGSVVIEYPDLPAGTLDVSMQLLDASGCVVGETAVPLRVRITGGEKTSAEIVLRRAATSCGDGGSLSVSDGGGSVDAAASEAARRDAATDSASTADTGDTADVPLGGSDLAPFNDGTGGRAGTGGTVGGSSGGVGGGPDGPSDAQAIEVALASGTGGAGLGGMVGSGGAGTGGRSASGGSTGLGGSGTGGASPVGTGGTTSVNTQPVCNNGTVESGETCDPISTCQSQALACVSDATTIRTPSGAVASCTFVCTSTARGCVAGDGYCPSGCTRATDGDCPKEPGDACQTGNECRLGFCVDSVCCDHACNAACEACNRAGNVGKCTLPDFNTDPLNCGSCGAACSTQHMVSATCTGGACTGACAPGYDDCDADRRTNGCETNLTGDANHCGACTTVCQAGVVCQGSACVTSRWGLSGSGPASITLGTSTLVALAVTISGSNPNLVGLGGWVVTPNVKLRLGLYSNPSGAPSSLIAQTGELTGGGSAGAVEGFFTGQTIAAGSYWLVLSAASTVEVGAESTSVPWFYVTPVTYGPLPSQFPAAQTIQQKRAHLYAITSP